MENKNKKYFDMGLLVEQGDLNILNISETHNEMTAGEYFDMLLELMSNAQMISEGLNNLVHRDGDRNTFKNLTGMFKLLIDLGYDKHEADFDGLLDSYDRGQSRLIVMYAKKILESFDSFSARLKAARIPKPPKDNDVDPYEVTIKEWLDNHYMKGDNSKPVILAVDDSPMILKSVSSLLSNDYKVYMLAKSVMLEKMLSQIEPDLFLLDYNMPDINGFELIPVIRNFEQHKDTPIIFLTSEGTIDNISSAIMLGASDFIAKPVKPSTLRSRIRKHLVPDSENLENAS